jgi:hypothetical protein
MYPQKPHVVQDDIESFVHVFLYHSLRYLDHTACWNIQHVLDRIFDDYFIDADGTYRGGLMKKLLFQSKSSILGEKFHFTNNPALTYFVNFAMKAVRGWHEYADSVENEPDPLQDNPAFADIDLPVLDVPRLPKDFDTLDLRDHRQLAEVWDKMLSLSVWPSDDKAIDRLPSAKSGSSGKRSYDEDYDEESTPKKKKAKSRSKCGTSGGSSALSQERYLAPSPWRWSNGD